MTTETERAAVPLDLAEIDRLLRAGNSLEAIAHAKGLPVSTLRIRLRRQYGKVAVEHRYWTLDNVPDLLADVVERPAR